MEVRSESVKSLFLRFSEISNVYMYVLKALILKCMEDIV